MKLLAYLPLAAALVLTTTAHSTRPYLGDHITFWYAGNLVATGRSPYDITAWREAAEQFGEDAGGAAVNAMRKTVAESEAVWVYPPWTAYLFVPVGLLPPDLGTAALHAVLLASAIAAIALLAEALPWRSRAALALAALLLVTWLPLVLSIRTGHLGALLLLGVALVTLGLRRGSAPAIIVGSLLLFIKPQITVLFAVVVAGRLASDHHGRRTAAAVAAVLAVVALAAVARDPSAMGALESAIESETHGQGYRHFQSASLWALGPNVPAAIAVVVPPLALAAAAVLGILTVRSSTRAMRSNAVVAVALVLSPMILPYVHVYDFVVLAPALLLSVFFAESATDRRGPALVICTLVAAVLPVTIYVLFIAGILPVQTALMAVPLMTLATLAFSATAAEAGRRAMTTL